MVAVLKKRVRAPKRKRLPNVLSDAEVRAIIGRVRSPVQKAGMLLMYACGLRVSEAATLEVTVRARLLLLLSRPANSDFQTPSSEIIGDATDRPGDHTPFADRRICPHCQQGHLIHIGRLYPKQASGP